MDHVVFPLIRFLVGPRLRVEGPYPFLGKSVLRHQLVEMLQKRFFIQRGKTRQRQRVQLPFGNPGFFKRPPVIRGTLPGGVKQSAQLFILELFQLRRA